MRRILLPIVNLIITTNLLGCQNSLEKVPAYKMIQKENTKPGTFRHDLEFLKNYQELIILSSDNEQNQLIICPGWQARIMTSSAEGSNGKSLGWINYDLIKSKTILPHINPFGGEDRFWIGPEGGQYSIFFKKGDPFDLEHWQTPKALDTESFIVNEKQKTRASFSKNINLENYSGTKFSLQVKREITLFGREKIKETFNTDLSNLKAVGFQSQNTITNTGQHDWTKPSGLLSIWILGMFPATEETKVVIPFKGSENENIVNDAYFGKLSDKNLRNKKNRIYFKADGKYRSKIGISQERADSVLGSYDGYNKILTIIIYSLPQKPQAYVNSLWELQKFPYKGDVINAYNDGPSSGGSKGFGSFYEIETSSPAVELNSMESISHIHKTFHFYGEEQKLDQLSKTVLGVSLAEITEAFK